MITHIHVTKFKDKLDLYLKHYSFKFVPNILNKKKKIIKKRNT